MRRKWKGMTGRGGCRGRFKWVRREDTEERERERETNGGKDRGGGRMCWRELTRMMWGQGLTHQLAVLATGGRHLDHPHNDLAGAGWEPWEEEAAFFLLESYLYHTVACSAAAMQVSRG